MRENTDQKNSEYRLFSRSDSCLQLALSKILKEEVIEVETGSLGTNGLILFSIAGQ